MLETGLQMSGHRHRNLPRVVSPLTLLPLCTNTLPLCTDSNTVPLSTLQTIEGPVVFSLNLLVLELFNSDDHHCDKKVPRSYSAHSSSKVVKS